MHLTNPFIEIGIAKGIAKGIEKGIQQGRQEEGIEIVLHLLGLRLGTLPASQRKRIEKLNLTQIKSLSESLLDFKSRSDLTRWLKKHTSLAPSKILPG